MNLGLFDPGLRLQGPVAAVVFYRGRTRGDCRGRLQLIHVSTAAAAASTAAAATVGTGPGSSLERTRARLPGSRGAGVRVHVVAGYDVYADIARRPAAAFPAPPRERHCRLAATVVEEVDVSVAEVPVSGAVHQVVEARFAEREPRQVVEHLRRQFLDGG